MQENRSFDSYFGTYPGADGIPMRNGKPTVCLPVLHGGCVRPFHDLRDRNVGGPHNTAAFVADVNAGKMNGFAIRQQTGLANCKVSVSPACGFSASGTPDAVGYHTGADIRNYWSYARNFVLQDHMFQADSGFSLPSHLYMVSEWSAKCSQPNVAASCVNNDVNPPNPPDFAPQSHLPAPSYAWTDLTYLMHKHHVSWRYYLYQGTEPDCVNAGEITCGPVVQKTKSPGIWNPLPYFTTVQQDSQLGNIQSVRNFFTAAKTGHLPAVSWVIPSLAVSEHPLALVAQGQTYVTGVINAVMRSPDWNSTAIFLALGRLGRLLRPCQATGGGSERLRNPRPRDGDQPLRPARLH